MQGVTIYICSVWKGNLKKFRVLFLELANFYGQKKFP